jgi:hypothetical protein
LATVNSSVRNVRRARLATAYVADSSDTREVSDVKR